MFLRLAFLSLFCFSLFGAEAPTRPYLGRSHVYLKTPNFSAKEIMGTNVGIRPYRKTGVRIEAENVEDKLIIHNYGYGGSGLTLSLGGAKEVMDILSKQKWHAKTVAVLGGGVIGLATAYELLEKGYDVHIYAADWSPNLTSNVGAGIWSPLTFGDLPEEKKKLHERMLETSEERFLRSTGNKPEFAGIKLIWSYSFKSGSSNEAIKTKHRGEEVIVHFDNGTTKVGRRIQEVGIDGKLFMEDLFSKVKKRAHLHTERFESIDDILNLQESVIVNCLSLGSRELFDDQDFVPVRGQIIYFKPQKGIDYLLYQNVPNNTNTWVSLFPWSDRIILGGVYEAGMEDLVTNPETLKEIIQNAQKCLEGKL